MNLEQSRLTKQEVAEFIKSHEGVSLKPYLDTKGKWSIGIGRNLDDCGIRMDEALFMFDNDINQSISDLTKVLPEWLQCPPEVQLVLIDMMFQLGIVGFCGFKKMIAAVKQHDYNKMIEEIKDSLYAKQVPSRAEDNISRIERVLDSVQKV